MFKNKETLAKIGKLSKDEADILFKDLADNSDLVKAMDADDRVVDGWKKMYDLGFDNIIRKNPVFADKVGFFTNQGLIDGQIKKILKSRNPKALEIAENCLKRKTPYKDFVHNLVENANKLEGVQAGFLDKVKVLVSNERFLNIEQLKDALGKGLADIKSGSKGIFTEIDEAVRLVRNGKEVKLGLKTKQEELDIVNVTNHWVMECKNVSSKAFGAFNTNLKRIGDKFSDTKKMSEANRKSFETGGGLKGKIEISNPEHPFYKYDSESKFAAELHHVLGDKNVLQSTKDGILRMNELRIKNGSGEFILVKGKHF